MENGKFPGSLVMIIKRLNRKLNMALVKIITVLCYFYLSEKMLTDIEAINFCIPLCPSCYSLSVLREP